MSHDDAIIRLRNHVGKRILQLTLDAAHPQADLDYIQGRISVLYKLDARISPATATVETVETFLRSHLGGVRRKEGTRQYTRNTAGAAAELLWLDKLVAEWRQAAT